MFDINKVCLLGGDRRQVYLARSMARDGKFVTCFALDGCEGGEADFASLSVAVSKCDTVILPMPLSKDGKTLFAPYSDSEIALNEELAALLSGKRIFCAGKEKLLRSGSYDSSMVCDYLAREELAVQNAVPTAEGAIAAAVTHSPKTLHKSRCLISGFGRIGKILARDLKALGADVTVSARKPSDLAWITSLGYSAVNTADIRSAGSFDHIFNTIPSMIFDRETLAKTARNAVVIDLASKPGGVDTDACAALHIHAVEALSLPGKTAPETAAEIIKDTIYNMAREEPS